MDWLTIIHSNKSNVMLKIFVYFFYKLDQKLSTKLKLLMTSNEGKR